MDKLNTKEVMINFTVKCMLNPNNKFFYIKNLTLDKLSKLIAGDSERAEVLFTAFERAQSRYLEQAAIDEYFTHIHTVEGCPECGCSRNLGYIAGVACPNCDYVENV